jgi:hypothetical protein
MAGGACGSGVVSMSLPRLSAAIRADTGVGTSSLSLASWCRSMLPAGVELGSSRKPLSMGVRAALMLPSNVAADALSEAAAQQRLRLRRPNPFF